MAWAKGGNAGSDKKSGVIAVQIRLCHHVVRDVTRLHTLIKFIADLTTGGGRSLPDAKVMPLEESAPWKLLLSTA